MKESYGEGLASHTDPESCVVSREAGHEALTGALAGGVSSIRALAKLGFREERRDIIMGMNSILFLLDAEAHST
jgi:hypothetical protein